MLNGLYGVRPALTHGRYLFQLDEAPWSFGIASSVVQEQELEDLRPAPTVAKEVLRN